MGELGIKEARKGLGTGSNRTSRQGTNSEVFQYLPESTKTRPSTNNKRNNNRNKKNNNRNKINIVPQKTLQQKIKLPGPYSNLKDGWHFIPGDKWHQAKWTWVINGHPVTATEIDRAKKEALYGPTNIAALEIGKKANRIRKAFFKSITEGQVARLEAEERAIQSTNEAIAALEIGKKANRIRKEIQHQVFDRMTSADNPDYPTQSKHEATKLQRAEHLNRLNELGIQKPR